MKRKIDLNTSQNSIERQKQKKEKEILEVFFQKQNPLEKALKEGKDELIAKAIQDLMKKDTLH